jgi:hypothetical protein
MQTADQKHFLNVWKAAALKTPINYGTLQKLIELSQSQS